MMRYFSINEAGNAQHEAHRPDNFGPGNNQIISLERRGFQSEILCVVWESGVPAPGTPERLAGVKSVAALWSRIFSNYDDEAIERAALTAQEGE